VNVIIPPKVYARDRLTVRTEPLVVVEGVLERFASAGGAINLLVRRIAPLDAPDLLSRRPHAQVKDFSMLDARELARIALEQPRVGHGGGPARDGRPRAPRCVVACCISCRGSRQRAPPREPATCAPPRHRPPHHRPLVRPRTRPPSRTSRCPRAAPAPRTSGPWLRRS
jgi:hypothetical protein